MAAPLVMPREYGIRLPLLEELPTEMRAEVERDLQDRQEVSA